MQAKQKDSPIWKTICKKWSHVIKGIFWAISNGENVKFWEDEWLDGFGSLARYATQDLSKELLNKSMVEMVSNNN